MKRKMLRILSVIFMVTTFLSPAIAADRSSVRIESMKPNAKVSLDRIIDETKVVVTVSDSKDKPITGLTSADFEVFQFGKKAQVKSVESYAKNLDVPRNIVLILDNSDSMRQREAIEPMLAAMDELFKIVRPIDQVSIVAFAERGTEHIAGRDLRVRTFQSNQPVDLKNFVSDVYSRGITSSTVLYEGILAGLDLIGKMPAEQPRFMVVFSDGEDLNSAFKPAVIQEKAAKLEKFDAYAIDYMPGSGTNPFLQSFADRHQGQVWKATAATNLLPIFQEVATKLQYRYVVTYGFPLEGSLAVSPQNMTIEEIKVIDASPMLGHIYFDTDSSTISDRYIRFRDQASTRSFDERQLRGALEKYYQVLNLLGKRMQEHPETMIKLVGCNADVGPEKGDESLSLQRAEAVKAYLQYLWNIAPDRIQVEARNLPQQPSTSQTETGQEDNRRVEIKSQDAEILDLIRSNYTSYRIDVQRLTLRPNVESPYGIDNWRGSVSSGNQIVASLGGEGNPKTKIDVPLQFADVKQIAKNGALDVNMEIVDKQGQTVSLKTSPIAIDFIETRERLAQKLDFKVQEKYALILFDFNSSIIDMRNETIVSEIVARIRELPEASVDIVGHTDDIGPVDYNVWLSERRAKAVYDLIMQYYGDDPEGRIRFSGVGPDNPLFDNQLPETRSFNRTVTITLEYLATE